VRSRAERYDWELAQVAGRQDQDLESYSELAQSTGGPVLELGCGTGRLTVPLGAVGLDIDADMLAVARRRGARQLVRADMRRFALARRFGLVAIPYNSLQLLLSDDDRVSCLRCAVRHLSPAGVVALEVTDFQQGAVRTWVAPELLASAEGLTLHGGLVHDLARRVTTYHRRFQEGGRWLVDHAELRSLDRAELLALLDRADLAVADLREGGARLFCAARPLPQRRGEGHQPHSSSASSRQATALPTRARALLA
jgi:SAM-dependent methyltransferase